MARKLIIECRLSPGDILMFSAAIRDLKVAHPHLAVDVRTPRPDLFENNPHITHIDDGDPEAERFEAHYPLINQSNQLPYHFIHGYRMFLEEKLELKIPQGPFHGDLHLTARERMMPSPFEQQAGSTEPYWIVVNGGKRDFTVKHWHPVRMQEVVSHFAGKLNFVQTGLNEHMHHQLAGPNVVNLMNCMGRDFIRLVYHAEGVICPITFAMHLAAAVPQKPGRKRLKPCVVTAGGREAVHWEGYTGHRFLHTTGSLPCCAQGGCWKARVVKLNDGDSNDNHLCERPVIDRGVHIPKCMDLIRTEDVIRAVESYLEFA